VCTHTAALSLLDRCTGRVRTRRVSRERSVFHTVMRISEHRSRITHSTDNATRTVQMSMTTARVYCEVVTASRLQVYGVCRFCVKSEKGTFEKCIVPRYPSARRPVQRATGGQNFVYYTDRVMQLAWPELQASSSEPPRGFGCGTPLDTAPPPPPH
jgi:hypothetical protein